MLRVVIFSTLVVLFIFVGGYTVSADSEADELLRLKAA